MMRIRSLLTSTFCLMAACSAQAQGGAWALQASGSSAGLRGLYAVNSRVVWASGTGGTILRTENGGIEWKQCAVPPDGAKLDFRGVWAWDTQTALVLSSGPGEQSRLYRTTDGCGSWKLLFTNPDGASGFWDGLLFLDQRLGFIYGDPVPDAKRTQREAIPLRVTHDGGATWNLAKPGLPSLKGEGFFAASNSSMTGNQTGNQGWLWLGTTKARILRSQQGGAWLSAQTPLASGNDSSGVFSLAFRDPMHGVAVGGDYRKPENTTGVAAYTSDGGEHWSAVEKPPHGYRSAVAWEVERGAWITAGSNGSDISYDDGKTWQWLDSGNWNALSLPWAAGPHGQIGKLGTLAGKPAAASSVSR